MMKNSENADFLVILFLFNIFTDWSYESHNFGNLADN